MDLREIGAASPRTHANAQCPGRISCFPGPFAKNIILARPDAAFADVVRRCFPRDEEFIERLREDHDGGGRRAPASRPATAPGPGARTSHRSTILILDEATSSLDAESEAIVNANLKRMSKDARHLSVSRDSPCWWRCDAICGAGQGRLYDLGTHEELLQRYDHLALVDGGISRAGISTPRPRTPLLMSRGAAR